MWFVVINLICLMCFFFFFASAFMYGCESWTIKKAESWRIDAFELWCWRRLLRVHLVNPKGHQL